MVFLYINLNPKKENCYDHMVTLNNSLQEPNIYVYLTYKNFVSFSEYLFIPSSHFQSTTQTAAHDKMFNSRYSNALMNQNNHFSYL